MAFISCDWGTSSFRCRLIAAPTGATLAEIKSSRGIAVTHEKWRQSGNQDRQAFYQAFLLEQIRTLSRQTASVPDHQATALDGLPLIISGMATSTLGMLELPYKDLPFLTDGRDLARLDLPPTPQFPHPLTLISGVQSPDDVMRGEETLLVGAALEGTGSSIIIFPGTHSKHVFVQNGSATSFKTYMTGEFFSLLSQHSILAASLTEAPGALSASFEKGVDDSRNDGLLHNAFRIRTNTLFGKMSKEDNTHYLSGLLIGAELNELGLLTQPETPNDKPATITLVASGHLRDVYARALLHLGHRGFSIIDDSQALIAAHLKILNLAG